jgi:hypothetical protein
MEKHEKGKAKKKETIYIFLDFETIKKTEQEEKILQTHSRVFCKKK